MSQDNIPVTFGQQYTISCYARCTQGTAVLRMAVWRSAAETYYRHITLNSSSDSSWKRYSLTYTHDFANSKAVTNVYFGENVSTGTLQICGMKFEMGSIPSDWSVCPEDVSDDIAQAQKAAGDAQFTADAARSALQRVVRIDNSGLHVGDNLSTGEVLIDSESVNVVMNGNRYSKFAGNYVQFGNYQLRRTVDGGLAFKMTDI